jgi:transcription elongation GreA/GreB family factor
MGQPDYIQDVIKNDTSKLNEWLSQNRDAQSAARAEQKREADRLVAIAATRAEQERQAQITRDIAEGLAGRNRR